jgi:hypothetical protein
MERVRPLKGLGTPVGQGHMRRCIHDTQGMKKEHIQQMSTDRMIPRHVYNKPFTVRFPERSAWKGGFQPDRKGRLMWYTDGFKINKNTGAGVISYGTRWKLSFNLVQYTTVFQANLDRKYRNIYILSDSQAAIKALDNYQIISKLVWDCHQSLLQLAKYNRVQLIWVSGHESIAGNENAAQLAKFGSE